MRIGRNVLFNLIGFFCPAVILFVSYPPFLHALGAELFGILTLAMSLAAGLSFLDFGLTAASLRFVVSDVHRRDFGSAARVVMTSLSFFGALGLFISMALFVLSPHVVSWMNVAPARTAEAIVIFRLTALQIACSLFLGTLGGLFKALDRFDLAAGTLTLVSLSMYGIPAFQVAALGQSLQAALCTTDLTLLAMCVAGVVLMWRVAASRGVLLGHGRPDKATWRQIFVHGQRILVGFMFGPVSLTSYQLSLTLVSKVHAAINAAAEVALPVASSAQHALIKRTYLRGMLLLFVMSVIPLATIAAFSHVILGLWLGPNAPQLAVHLLPLMCVAYMFVALSALPYHLLNGLGHPGVNVAFAIFNILIYALVLAGFELMQRRDVMNVAIAYAAANVVCGICFQVYCYRLFARLPTRDESAHQLSAQT